MPDAPAQHTSPDGATRGWDAADVDPSEYSSDDYAAGFPELAGEPSDGGHRGMRATQVNITRDNLRTIASRTGRRVVEAWSDHDEGLMGTVVGVMLHHTGSAWGTAVAPTLQIVREGRSDLQNALCTFYIDRAGTIYLVTEKVAWHAGVGSWRGITDGNGHFLGIEAESDGVHWTTETVDAYVSLVAEIARFLGADPALWTPRHAEFALPVGRKTDFGGLDEPAFRARVATQLNPPPAPAPVPAPTPTPVRTLEAPMLIATQLDVKNGPITYAVLSGGILTGLDPASTVSAEALAKAGVPVLWVSKNDWTEMVRKSQLLAK